MHVLKILVVVMGVTLIGGLALLVVLIAGRLSRNSSALHSFAATSIDIPRDAKIGAMAAGTDRLVMELVLPGGERQLVIVDLATGTRLGTIELRSLP
jgi:hypothetical protein